MARRRSRRTESCSRQQTALDGGFSGWAGQQDQHEMAYANPPNRADEKQRGDGFGTVRFNKTTRQVTFECWPRFASVDDGDEVQFDGWPITINNRDNDGRKPVGFLPELVVTGIERPVVQVVEMATNEILYTVRADSNRFRAPVYSQGQFTLKVGKDKADLKSFQGLVLATENDETVCRPIFRGDVINGKARRTS